MPNNGHDISSREIFSSASPVSERPPHPSGVLDGAAGARSAGPIMSATPVASPASVDQSVQPASDGALVASPRPATAGVGQDKAALTRGSVGSREPGPDTNGVRVGLVETKSTRSQPARSRHTKKVKGGVWMEPTLKDALHRIARASGLSFSAAAAKGLEIFARAAIHEQEEELFEPRMRTMLRQEIRALDNRHIYFEMKNAIAAEQTRILTADLYKRELQKEGLSPQQIEAKLDTAYRLARGNILKKTPQLRALLDEWWAATDATKSKEGKAVRGKP